MVVMIRNPHLSFKEKNNLTYLNLNKMTSQLNFDLKIR